MRPGEDESGSIRKAKKTFYKKIDFGVNRGCLFWDSIMEDSMEDRSARIFQDPSAIHENLADSDQVGPCKILFHIMDLRPNFFWAFHFCVGETHQD